MTTDYIDSITDRSQRIAAEIGRKHLHGTGAAVQGAVLVDLVAMWLAGHMPIPLDTTDRAGIDAYREQILSDFIIFVRRLVPVNEKIILEKYTRGGA